MVAATPAISQAIPASPIFYTGPVSLTNTAVLVFEGRKSGYLSARSTNIYSGKIAAAGLPDPLRPFTNQTTVAVQSGLPGVSSGLDRDYPQRQRQTPNASSTDTLLS